jgi:hypothetical protein
MKMTGAAGVVALALLVVPGLLGVPAGADTGEHSDPDDSPGVLDIATIDHGHKMVDGRRKLVHTITTFESWDLDDINSNDSLQMEFQLPGNNRTSPPERLIVINVKKGALKAKMYDTRGDPPAFIANLALSRPTGDSIRVTFGKRLLRKSLGSYKWRAFTYYEKTDSPCSRPEACSDQAPARLWLRHEL